MAPLPHFPPPTPLTGRLPDWLPMAKKGPPPIALWAQRGHWLPPTGHPALTLRCPLPSPTGGLPAGLRGRPFPSPTFPTPHLPSRPPPDLPDPPPTYPTPLFRWGRRKTPREGLHGPFFTPASRPTRPFLNYRTGEKKRGRVRDRERGGRESKGGYKGAKGRVG